MKQLIRKTSLKIILALVITFLGFSVTLADNIPNKAISWNPDSDTDQQFREIFSAGKSYSWEKVSSETDKNGNVHTRYKQKFDGIEVENGNIILHSIFSKHFITGEFIPVIKFDPINFNPSQRQQELIKKHVPSSSKLTTLDGMWKWIKISNTEIAKLYFIISYRPDTNLHEITICIDPVTGEKSTQKQSSCFANCTGNAETMYSGTKPISTYSDSGNYYLKSTLKGLGINTKNLNNQLGYQHVTQFADADNYWEQPTGSAANYAHDAHFCAEKYYDFLNEKFGRNSLDNAGFPLTSYLNYGTGFTNAFWNGQAVVYGSGNNTITPFTTPDISGHEFTHGLIQKTAGLQYSGEPGIINEAISDMLGVALENFIDSTQDNWLIGELTGLPLRSLMNPSDYNQPASYHGVNWYYGTGDQGGVHINSGFLNKWYYIITTGEQGISESGITYNVTGMGMSKSVDLIYHTLTSYLLPNSGFNDLKIYSLLSAIDLYGYCSPEYNTVLKAWDAVSFGSSVSFPVINHNGNNSICQGDSLLIKVDFYPGEIYQWKLNGLLVHSGTDSEWYISQPGIWSVTRINCVSAIESAPIQINIFPVTRVSAGIIETCYGTPVNLTGFPLGGNFNIANPYLGNSTGYEYYYTDLNGCSLTASGYVQVNELPAATILTPSQSVPVNDELIALQASVPGNFSGVGVINNYFDPAAASIGGPYRVALTYTDIRGCVASDTINMEVISACQKNKETVTITTAEVAVQGGTIVKFKAEDDAKDFRYLWKFPESCIVNGAVDEQTVSALWNGNESMVLLYLINTCNDTLVKEVMLSEKIKLINSQIEVYPNPTHGTLTIQLDADITHPSEIILSDINGKKLECIKTFEKKNTYFMNKFPKGIYLIQISSGNKIYTEKIVLN